MKTSLKFKKWLWLSVFIVVFIAIASLFISAGDDDNMPNPDGSQLWNYITDTNPYENWGNWPGFEGIYEGQSPHGAYLKLYVNPEAKTAIESGYRKMPDNAILVKENYNEEKKLLSVTTMYKVKNYNPEAGDWFWAKYGTDGKIMEEGKVNSCIGCHNIKSSDDYIYTFSKEK